MVKPSQRFEIEKYSHDVLMLQIKAVTAMSKKLTGH